MKIVRDTGRVLLLRGVPIGLGWALYATLLGPVLCAAAVTAAIFIWDEAIVGAVAFGGVGGSIAIIVFLTGLDGMLTREKLEIDRNLSKATYRRWKLYTSKGAKEWSFAFDRVARVDVRKRTESGGGGKGFNNICSADLRIDKPRRSITLDETSSNGEQRVERIAEAVAEVFGVEVRKSGSYN